MLETLSTYTSELLLIGIFLLGYIARTFAAPYITEKAKNTATKEDIEAITSKVEGIKSQLSELSNFKATRRANQEKHLLSFHDAAVEMLHERYSVNFGDFPMDEGQSLYSFQTEFHKNITKLLKEYQRLALYIEKTDDLYTYASAAIRSALNSKKVFKENFSAVKTTCINEQLAYKSGNKDEYKNAASTADQANSKYWNEMHPHIEEYRGALQLYVNSLNGFLASPSPS